MAVKGVRAVAKGALAAAAVVKAVQVAAEAQETVAVGRAGLAIHLAVAVAMGRQSRKETKSSWIIGTQTLGALPKAFW